MTLKQFCEEVKVEYEGEVEIADGIKDIVEDEVEVKYEVDDKAGFEDEVEDEV